MSAAPIPATRRRAILTTGLFGASSLGNLAVGILRAKFCALAIHPYISGQPHRIKYRKLTR